jgi:hypothetical protein
VCETEDESSPEQPTHLQQLTRQFPAAGQHSSGDGALLAAAVDPARAEYFLDGVRSGYILVLVDAGNRALEAECLLRAYGADLGEQGQSILLDERELQIARERPVQVFGDLRGAVRPKKAA